MAGSDPVMIYGATGYTGRLITSRAREIGLRPVLAGRSASKLAALAAPLGLEYRAVRLTEPDALVAALRGVTLVLHAAGPFSETARPMVDACLRTGTHYLDITGEIAAIEALARRDAEARARQVMLMPGVGFDVVPSDCLAAHVAQRLPGAQRLALGVAGLQFATRGSAKTLMEYAGRDVEVRRNGKITTVPPGTLQRSFDYGSGERASLNVGWGDVSSAYYTTGIPNIEVYFESTPTLQAALTTSRYLGRLLSSGPGQAWLQAFAEMLPEGPTDEQRRAVQMAIVAEAEDHRGRRACARLRTPEAYTCTGLTAPAIARRVLNGDLEVGFQTPARVYGADFILSQPGTSREDMA